MTFAEAIDAFKSMTTTKELVSQTLGDLEAGLIDVYLKDNPEIDSEIVFFDVDKIPGMLEITVDGIRYVNLFPLEMLQEMVQDYSKLSSGKLSDSEIAKKILDYRMRDA